MNRWRLGGGVEMKGQKRRAPRGRMLNLESGLFHLTTCRINGCEFQLRSGGALMSCLNRNVSDAGANPQMVGYRAVMTSLSRSL